MSKIQKPGFGRFLSSLIAIPIVVALVGVTPTSAKPSPIILQLCTLPCVWV